MPGTYPTLPGLTYSTIRAPKFATRTQKAVSGRVLRIADQIYPIYTWTLIYSLLRDAHDLRGGANVGPGIGFDELRTLEGFYLQNQGAFGTFLFDDPSDDSITGQTLPQAISYVVGGTVSAGFTGVNYLTGDIVSPQGGGGSPASFVVTASGGSVTALTLVNSGAYQIIPQGRINYCSTYTDGAGTGLLVNLTWTTLVQTQRAFGGFTEPVVSIKGSPTVYLDGNVATIQYCNSFHTGSSIGTGYAINDLITPNGGTVENTHTLILVVKNVNGSGGILSLDLIRPGAYYVNPGTTNISTYSSGPGVGANLDLTWLSYPITANAPNPGIIELGSPGLGLVFVNPAGPPIITADFGYYFNARFADDTADFENFLYQLWELKQIKLESIIPTVGTTFTLGGAGVTYIISWYYIDLPPTAGNYVMRKTIDTTGTLPAGLTGSVATAAVAGTGTTIFDIAQNGSNIGTMTFASGQTSATFAMASPVVLNVNDVITVIPRTSDATLSGLSGYFVV